MRRALLLTLLVIGIAATAAAQGNPTGAIRGAIVDPDNLPLPGVTVTVTSPAVQGTAARSRRPTAIFIIPFLPAGEYRSTSSSCKVSRRTSGPLGSRWPIRSHSRSSWRRHRAGTVTVQGSATTELLDTSTVASTYKTVDLERLPVGRTLNAAVLLAPGVTANGPGGNIIDLRRHVVREPVPGQRRRRSTRTCAARPSPLFIEDAIQETKISTGDISAEYGRFGGGVVNMITKSGGNIFSGSFPHDVHERRLARADARSDRQEGQAHAGLRGDCGGPIRRDKLWFFGACRYTKTERNRTTRFTRSTTRAANDGAGTRKATCALNTMNNLMGSYTKRATKTTNNTFGMVMDKDSLYDNSTDQHLYVVNYTNVITDTSSSKGGRLSKISATLDTGSQFTDRQGTPIATGRGRSTGAPDSTRRPFALCAMTARGRLARESRQLGLVREGNVLPLHPEDRVAQHRVRLRQLQGVAQEQQLAVRQRLLDQLHRGDHRWVDGLPGVQQQQHHLRQLDAAGEGNGG